MAVIFLLATVSAVLSTVDSAILSPASVLSQNILAHVRWIRLDDMRRSQLSIVLIATASLIIAFLGERCLRPARGGLRDRGGLAACAPRLWALQQTLETNAQR